MAQGDGAAVDVHLVHVRLHDLGPGEHHGGEGLVDLDHVEVRELHPGLSEDLLGGVDGPVQQIVGIGAHHHVVEDPGPGSQAVLFGLLRSHVEQGRDAVGDL